MSKHLMLLVLMCANDHKKSSLHGMKKAFVVYC